MSRLNCDILYHIAIHLPASPIEYCKLQYVSRTFRTVFSSDQVWESLNVYGLSSDVYTHFINEAKTYPKAMNLAFESKHVPFTMINYLKEHCRLSLYVQFGCIVNNLLEYEISSTQLMLKLLPRLPDGMAIQVSPELARNKQVGMAACKFSGSHLVWLDPELQDDEDIVLQALQTGESDPSCGGDETLFYASKRLREKRHILLAALNAGTGYLPANVAQDEELLRAVVQSNPKDNLFLVFNPNDADKLRIEFKEVRPDCTVVECTGPRSVFSSEESTVEIWLTERNAVRQLHWIKDVFPAAEFSQTEWLKDKSAQAKIYNDS